jgi:hypothetical protein
MNWRFGSALRAIVVSSVALTPLAAQAQDSERRPAGTTIQIPGGDAGAIAGAIITGGLSELAQPRPFSGSGEVAKALHALGQIFSGSGDCSCRTPEEVHAYHADQMRARFN